MELVVCVCSQGILLIILLSAVLLAVMIFVVFDFCNSQEGFIRTIPLATSMLRARLGEIRPTHFCQRVLLKLMSELKSMVYFLSKCTKEHKFKFRSPHPLSRPSAARLHLLSTPLYIPGDALDYCNFHTTPVTICCSLNCLIGFIVVGIFGYSIWLTVVPFKYEYNYNIM